MNIFIVFFLIDNECITLLLRNILGGNQDGGVGRHTAPPRTTRTDRESNSRGTDTKEIENKHIQPGRRGGDGHRGREDSRGCGGTETGGVWDKWRRQYEH